ncbi:MAG: sulfatase-like hydrolase/transferase [Sphingobacteriales bacterium]|nr:sulfatase-like hydrolase/transferase [Sphingobacteriales bacterium]
MDKARTTLLRLTAQLSILLVLYFICRLIFIFYNRAAFNFHSTAELLLTCFYGLRFDLSAIAFTNLIFITGTLLPAPFTLNRYYQSFLNYLFILSNGFFLLLNFADTAYYPFITKRMQFDALRFVNGEKGNDFYTLLPTFLLEYWHLWITCLLLLFLLYKAYKRTQAIRQPMAPSLKNYLYSSLNFLVVTALSVVAIRGGLQLKPLSIIHASEMVESKNIAAVLNTPFSVLYTIKKRSLAPVSYYPEKEITACYNGRHQPLINDPFNRQNVVILIVESLSKNYLGYFNSKAKTPFLDSVFSQGLVFPNGFANAKESIQGIPAILSSIPSWQDDPFIFSPYSANSITSFATILKMKGYQTSFFHGGSNGTMGFDSYCKLAGFDQYFGRNEYNNEADYDGDWGIWDEPFLQFMAGKLTEMPKPFFSAVFTLNTHHPYKVPDKYKDRFNQDGRSILNCVQYADLAIARFFETAKKTDWYNNTLFIITADHADQNTGNEQVTALDHYRIPIAFYKPDGSLKGVRNRIASQIDILPSTLHLLNYPDPYFSLGNDLFGNTCRDFSVSYSSGIYQYIDSSYCYQFNGQNGIGLFNWQTDTSLSRNLLAGQSSAGIAYQQEENLKKMIQSFTTSMIGNKMKF